MLFPLDGDASSFDASQFRSDLISQFPQATSFAITVTTGSIVADVVMLMPDATTANIAVTAVHSTTPEVMASSWFGGRVAFSAPPAIVSTLSSSTAGLPTDLGDTSTTLAMRADGGSSVSDGWALDAGSFVLGIVVLAIIGLAAYAVVSRRRQQRPSSTRHPEPNVNEYVSNFSSINKNSMPIVMSVIAPGSSNLTEPAAAPYSISATAQQEAL